MLNNFDGPAPAYVCLNTIASDSLDEFTRTPDKPRWRITKFADTTMISSNYDQLCVDRILTSTTMSTSNLSPTVVRVQLH